MPSTATIVGQLSVGQCAPSTADLVAKATLEIQGKLTGALKISGALSLSPPSLSAQLAGAIEGVAKLQAAFSAGITPPGATLTIAANLQLIASLGAQLAALLALSEAMAVAGIAVISYTGDGGQYGSKMQEKVASFAPPGNALQAVTFLATEPAAFAALGTVLLTG
jgi:hypothetical protein